MQTVDERSLKTVNAGEIAVTRGTEGQIMAGRKKDKRKRLRKAGILPARGAKAASGAQLRKNRGDGPTPELVRQKARALGVTAAELDWNASTAPLDVLLSKGMITERQHAAAMRLGYLRRMVLGRQGPTMMNWQILVDQVSSEHAPDRALTDEEKLEAAERAHILYMEAVDDLDLHMPGDGVSSLQSILDGSWPTIKRIYHAVEAMNRLAALWRMK